MMKMMTRRPGWVRPGRMAALLLALLPVAGAGRASAQALTTFRDADVVVGQTDFTSATQTLDAAHLYGPVSVAVSAQGKLAVGALGRVSIWNSVPATNGQPADVAVGKPDFTTPPGGVTSASNLNTILYSVAFSLDGQKLIVTDSTSNRVLIWNSVPTTNGQPADVVIGQSDFSSSNPGVAANRLSTPSGLLVTHGGQLLISDFSNHRVLIYNSIPTSNNASADVVIGQTDFTSNTNGNTATKLAGPANLALASNGRLLVADSGNNRVLVYNSIPTSNGAAADVVIGQSSFGQSAAGLAADRLNRPGGVSVAPDGRLAISELLNNRVLVYNSVPTSNGAAADVVLGQPDFTSNTPNNGGRSARSINSPLGVLFTARDLFVVDVGNYRALIFHSPSISLAFTSPTAGARVRTLSTISGTYKGDIAFLELYIYSKSLNRWWNGTSWVTQKTPVRPRPTINSTLGTWSSTRGPSMIAGGGYRLTVEGYDAAGKQVMQETINVTSGS